MKYTRWNTLLLMLILSFFAMYVVMYAMVDTFSNIYLTLNQLYMVLAMMCAMAITEVTIMGMMYERKIKIITIYLSIILLTLSIFFIRNQTAVSDKEFLKSMITHHGSALLMCNEANIKDVQIKELCNEIIFSQQSQIDFMKDKLSAY